MARGLPEVQLDRETLDGEESGGWKVDREGWRAHTRAIEKGPPVPS